jgi:hypothetical protein
MRTVLKITLGVLLAAAVLIAGCVALIGAGVDEATEDQQRHAITLQEFRALKPGMTVEAVRKRLGPPESAQYFENTGPAGRDASRCLYYAEDGAELAEGRQFQICFTRGRLDGRNIY